MSIDSNTKLLMQLERAMPIWLGELKGLHPLERGKRARSWTSEASREVNANRLKGRGVQLRAFNLLSRGLAAISLQPGGVTVFGRMWCARHHPVGRAMAPGERERMCDDCVTGQRVYEGLPPRDEFVGTLRALGDLL